MNKIFALFEGITINKSMNFEGVELFQNDKQRALLVQNYSDYEKEKSAMRNIEVIRCHLVAAAYFTSESYDVGIVSVWHDNEEYMQKKLVENPIPIERLLCKIPSDLELSAKTICWFARYLQGVNDDKQKIFCLYNAFGMIFDGFENIIDNFSDDIDIKIINLLLEKIKDYHNEDEMCEDKLYTSTISFTKNDIKKTEDCYVKFLRNKFPVYR